MKAWRSSASHGRLSRLRDWVGDQHGPHQRHEPHSRHGLLLLQHRYGYQRHLCDQLRAAEFSAACFRCDKCRFHQPGTCDGGSHESDQLGKPQRRKFWVGKPWIGTPPNSGPNSFVVQVPWVEVRDAKTNLVGRYAYWIDDESFRVNLQTANNGVRGNSSSVFQRAKSHCRGLGPGDC